jgi:hypothetical protein
MEEKNRSINVKVKLEKEDAGRISSILLKSSKSYKNTGKLLIAFFALVLLVLLFYVVLISSDPSGWKVAASIESKEPFPVWPVIFLAVIVLVRVGTPLIAGISAIRQFESNKLLQREIEYGFMSEGIISITASGQFHMNWDEVFKIIETKQYFAIFESTEAAEVIPKRCFSDNTDILAVSELMKSKLSPKKYVIIQGK